MGSDASRVLMQVSKTQPAEPDLRIYFAGGMFPGGIKEASNLHGYVFKPVGPTHGLPYVVCRGARVPAPVAADVDLLFGLVKRHAHLYQVDLDTGVATMARRSTECDTSHAVRAPGSITLSDGLRELLRASWIEKSAELGITIGLPEEVEESTSNVERVRPRYRAGF